MMSRTLSYAMPKKRQLGGIVGSTPQLSSPIPNVGGVTWMGNAPAPLSPLSQQILNQSGNLQAAKQNIDRVRAEKGLPSLYNPLPPPPMEEMPKKKKDYSEYAHMEKGGYVKGPQPPHALARGGQAGGTTDFGPGKGLGVIGGGMQGPLREVVTGGYGAMPARAGRIGYRGTLQERPGNRPSGLAGFYAMQREANLGKAAQTSIDPVTRMSYNPTDRDISAQMEMVSKKYGPREASMLGDYYNAGRTGDFARQQQAKDRIMARRQELATQRESEKWAQERKADEAMKAGQQPLPATPSSPLSTQSSPPATRTVMAQPYVNQYEQSINPVSTRAIPMNLAHGGYAKSSPIPVAPTNTGGRNPDGIPVKDAMAKLEHGGANEKVKPYIVNEKGEEAWQPDGEKPQLIPGKEKMVLFPKDGKVIPHGRTMEMAKKGKVEMPEHAADGARVISPYSLRNIGKWLAYKKPQWLVEQEQQEAAEREAKKLQQAVRQAALESMLLPGEGGKPIPVSAYPIPKEAPPPASPEEMEAATQQAINEFKAGQTAPQPVMPPPTIESAAWKASEQPQLLGETLTKAAPTPEQIKAQTGYTPEEMELLAQGQQMTERGIKQMSQPKMVDVGGKQRMMSDVVFESGGGIKGGKAFGPRVVDQQKPVTIRPGKIKDELGDVGTRLAKQKEDKEFMKRWESDLASGKAPETEKAFKKPMKLQRGGRTSGYAK